MKKAELITEVAERSEMQKKDVETVLKNFTEVVRDELVNGGKVQLVGFGTFEVTERKARVGKNPATKEEIQIPASKSPKFKAGKALKDAVNV